MNEHGPTCLDRRHHTGVGLVLGVLRRLRSTGRVIGVTWVDNGVIAGSVRVSNDFRVFGLHVAWPRL